ncbi:MAG: universal stress protein [Corynebacterium urealyticum]|uniref:Universal stress protein n=1 Tax=Corynebacterium urealyticum TaxID=43771 RepID=A0A2W5AZ99_9CORY|nr:MAG: universal stress protein [Corynebacterium urealyticum]
MSDQPQNTNSGREIIVAVDGSEASNTAVLWAANAALKRNQPLKLVSAYTMPQFMYADGMVPPQELYDDLEGEANDRIETAHELVRNFNADIKVSHAVKEGSPVDILLNFSRDAEMIVMGSRGLGGLSGLVMGSVSSAVVSHADCPVVVVRKDSDVSEESKYGPVVVGVDGSEVSRQAMEQAFREASARGASLTAVHAWNDSQFYASYAGLNAGEQEKAEHIALLKQEIAPFAERYPDVKVTEILARDRPVGALQDEAEGAQLLVLGSHGRGGFRGMLLGSTSRALLQYAPCPMMVVRPRNK